MGVYLWVSYMGVRRPKTQDPRPKNEDLKARPKLNVKLARLKIRSIDEVFVL